MPVEGCRFNDTIIINLYRYFDMVATSGVIILEENIVRVKVSAVVWGFIAFNNDLSIEIVHIIFTTKTKKTLAFSVPLWCLLFKQKSF